MCLFTSHIHCQNQKHRKISMLSAFPVRRLATMSGSEKFHKRLKICCGVALILLIVFVVISLILYFAMLKPKEPHVTPHPASLENIQLRIFPKFRLNVTLGMVITIRNPNYGSFKYKNTKAYISYRGTIIAEVPIEPEVVPARGELNIRTYASVTADKLVLNHHFLRDLVTGRFDLTSSATLQGTVSVLKVFKLRAEVFSTCDISIVVLTQGLESKCESKIRL